MTVLYFIRHAQPDYSNHDDRLRPLTEQGRRDTQLVTDYFNNKTVDAVLSSPYLRAIDTVKPLADSRNLPVILEEDFRERLIDTVWIEDFQQFSKKQWKDFNYKLDGGESLSEVQERNIRAIERVLKEYSGKTVVIGSHGTALSTIVNFYDPTFGFSDFEAMKPLMPWAVKLSFPTNGPVTVEKINLFTTDVDVIR